MHWKKSYSLIDFTKWVLNNSKQDRVFASMLHSQFSNDDCIQYVYDHVHPEIQKLIDRRYHESRAAIIADLDPRKGARSDPMTNEQKKQFHADKITALSKMIGAIRAIQHTNDQEDKWIASRVNQLRSELSDANDQFEALCQRPITKLCYAGEL